MLCSGVETGTEIGVAGGITVIADCITDCLLFPDKRAQLPRTADSGI